MSEIREILKQVYQSGYEDCINAKYGIRTQAHLIPVKEKEIIKIILDEIEKCDTQTEAWITSNFSEETYKEKNYYIKKQELKQRIKEWE